MQAEAELPFYKEHWVGWHLTVAPHRGKLQLEDHWAQFVSNQPGPHSWS